MNIQVVAIYDNPGTQYRDPNTVVEFRLLPDGTPCVGVFDHSLTVGPWFVVDELPEADRLAVERQVLAAIGIA